MNTIEEIMKEAVVQYAAERFDSLYSAAATAEEHAFSPRFLRRMKRLIARQKKPYYPYVNTGVKRVVAALLTLVVISSLTMSIKAIREPVVRFFVEVFEKYSSVVFQKSSNEVYVPDSIETAYEPTYIPKGYEEVRRDEDLLWVWLEFQNGSNGFIDYMQNIKNASHLINTEDTQTSRINKDGNEYIYYFNKGYHSILWEKHGYIFTLSGTEKQVLFDMAKSIAVKK